MNDTIPATGHLLGAADIRRIAADAGISPTKKFGQNFVIDPGTVRRIVREAGVTAADHVMEVGPGLGSLTLAILETGATMTAVEIDPPLAERLPGTVAEFMPEATSRLTVVNRDALTVTPENVPDFSDDASFTLVANLPYNVGPGRRRSGDPVSFPSRFAAPASVSWRASPPAGRRWAARDIR